MEVDWLVVDNAEKTILIVDLCKKLKIVQQNFPFCEVNQVETSPKIKLVLGKDLKLWHQNTQNFSVENVLEFMMNLLQFN